MSLTNRVDNHIIYLTVFVLVFGVLTFGAS